MSTMLPISQQPKATTGLSSHTAQDKHDAPASRSRTRRIIHKVTSKEGWLGGYDYAWLCMPVLPFSSKSRRPPPFYALDTELPLLLALTCGLQHALAMLAGLITPPIIFASSLNLDSATQAYMISASLIGCGECSFHEIIPRSHQRHRTIGILSLVQLSRIKLFKGYYLGTGMISVVGTSFTTLSTANAVSTLSTHASLYSLVCRYSMLCTLTEHARVQQHQTGLSPGILVQMHTGWCWERP